MKFKTKIQILIALFSIVYLSVPTIIMADTERHNFLPKNKDGDNVKAWILDEWNKAGASRQTAYWVIMHESSFVQTAYNVNRNRTFDCGVHQINSIHFTGDFTAKDCFDYKKNTAKAIEIWKRRGWSAWSSWKYSNFN